MSEREIPKEEAIKYIKEALLKPGIIIKTDEYIYALYEYAPERWRNVSLVFAEDIAWLSEVDTKRALLLLIDEVGKSLPRYKDKWHVILSEDELEEAISK